MRGKTVGKPRKGAKRDRKIRNFAEGEGAKYGGRILSKVRSLPVQNLETEQSPAFGKRILAMAGCGEYETLEEAAGRIVRVKEAIEPNAGTGARV